MTPLCFIDTETTGVHQSREIWEIAMIRRESENVDAEYQMLIDVDLRNADIRGLEIGGFYDRHPLGQWIRGGNDGSMELNDWNVKTTEYAAEMVARMTHKAVLIGAVPNFDTESLSVLLNRHKLVPSWHYHLIDVETMAVGYLQGHFRWATQENPLSPTPPWDSDMLSNLMEVRVPAEKDRHTAMGDADWARRMYDRIMRGTP